MAILTVDVRPSDGRSAGFLRCAPSSAGQNELGYINLYLKITNNRTGSNATLHITQIEVSVEGGLNPPEFATDLTQQVIFSFVHWQEQSRREAQLDYHIFRMQINKLYGQTLPEKIGDSILMWYDSNWTPHFSKANLARTEAVAAISEALDSFLNKNELDLSAENR